MSLKKIAHLANTSVSTVSRVLNHPDYKCKDPELEKRIWQIAREIKYTPDTNAKALKSGSYKKNKNPLTFDIFLTRFPSLSKDLFFSELFEALQKEMLQQECVPGKFFTLPDITSMINNKSAFSVTDEHSDGLIILGKCPSELIAPLRSHYHHLIGIDRNPTDFVYDEVICSGTAAASTAMDYLISLGHKKIAYIGDCSYEARYVGYYQSLISHNLPLDYSNIYPSSQTREEGMQIMQLILQKKELPSAIFCANDSTALGVYDCLRQHRKKGYVPSVISIDNIREAELNNPSLSTIDVPKEDMAHYAILLLKDQIRGKHKNSVRIELPCHLIVRESCSYCMG